MALSDTWLITCLLATFVIGLVTYDICHDFSGGGGGTSSQPSGGVAVRAGRLFDFDNEGSYEVRRKTIRPSKPLHNSFLLFHSITANK